MSFKHYRYDGFKRFKIDECPTDETSLCPDRKEAEAKIAKNNVEIDALQSMLYAEKREGVIFLFQAMDAAGKDGTIRAVLSCLSPHGVHEAAFKAPSALALSHDFLWRIVPYVPAKGEISKEKYDALQREIKETSDELTALKQSAKEVSDEFGNPIDVQLNQGVNTGGMSGGSTMSGGGYQAIQSQLAQQGLVR